MERVKVTQEQAELMEEVRGCASVSELCYERCLNGSWIGIYEPLNELNADEFARALYIGYEVIPEFKKGDWVVNAAGTIGEIKEIEGRIFQVFWGSGMPMRCNKDVFERHATEEEIAEEKERRFFRRNGREPWELKKGDVFSNKYNHQIRTIETIDDDYRDGTKLGTIFLMGDGSLSVTLNDLKHFWDIVCFAEDRKDVME